MRVVILGDGQWATDSLWRLLEAGHEVVAVWLRARPSEVGLEEAARALRLPVLQPARVNAPECVASLRVLAPDVVFSIAYNQILGADVRAVAPWCLNVHAGKLPRYRGRNVINWALINGESEVGITVHLVDDGIDTGDILLQRTVPVSWTDTYGDVLDRVVSAIPSLIVDSLALIRDDRAMPRPQGEGGTYFGGRREGDEWIDWSHRSIEIYNKIRAITHPGPGARTWLPSASRADAAQPVVIWRAAYEPGWPRYVATPGEVVGRSSDGVIVKTGDSTILVTRVQRGGDGREPETPRWPIGTRLGIDAGSILSALLAARESDHVSR